MKPFRLEDITIKLVDVAETARAMYGKKADFIAGNPLPPTDLRFEITAEQEGRKATISVHAGAKLSAEDILDMVNREGRWA